jgi:hypothetical protein
MCFVDELVLYAQLLPIGTSVVSNNNRNNNNNNNNNSNNNNNNLIKVIHQVCNCIFPRAVIASGIAGS